MRKVVNAGIVVLAAILGYLLLWPVPIAPVAWTSAEVRGLCGCARAQRSAGRAASRHDRAARRPGAHRLRTRRPALHGRAVGGGAAHAAGRHGCRDVRRHQGAAARARLRRERPTRHCRRAARPARGPARRRRRRARRFRGARADPLRRRGQGRERRQDRVHRCLEEVFPAGARHLRRSVARHPRALVHRPRARIRPGGCRPRASSRTGSVFRTASR